MNTLSITSARRLALMALAAVACAGPAQARDPINTEAGWRQQLARERRQIEADSAERERQCAQRFIVTACIEASRAQRREALADLNVREIALDDAERKQRATARQSRIDAKIAARESAASAAPPPPLDLVPDEVGAQTRPRRPALLPIDPSAPKKPPPRPDPDELKAREAEASAKFDSRQREAQERRDAAVQRDQHRQQSGKAPAPALPPASGIVGSPAASAPR